MLPYQSTGKNKYDQRPTKYNLWGQAERSGAVPSRDKDSGKTSEGGSKSIIGVLKYRKM